MAIIEVQKIQKKYGDLEVLKSIDLSIEEGEVVCIIGLQVLVNPLSFVA